MGFYESASLVRYVRVVAVARPKSTASIAQKRYSSATSCLKALFGVFRKVAWILIHVTLLARIRTPLYGYIAVLVKKGIGAICNVERSYCGLCST